MENLKVENQPSGNIVVTETIFHPRLGHRLQITEFRLVEAGVVTSLYNAYRSIAGSKFHKVTGNKIRSANVEFYIQNRREFYGSMGC